MSGKLIVIEGLDGSGKATQASLLYDNLKCKYDILKITFPDYKEPSSSLVKMYLNSEFSDNPDDVNAYAAASFFAVDRYASYMKYWKNDYLGGKIIISDRYSTSNMIYHMNKLPFEEWDKYLEWVEDYEYLKLSIPKPDIVIYLDVPIEISQQFMSKRYGGNESKKDIHEKNIEFLKKCRKSALYSAEKNNWKVINCAQNGKIKSIEEIHNEIIETLEKGDFLNA